MTETDKKNVTDDDWKKLIPENFSGTISIPVDGGTPVVTEVKETADAPAAMENETKKDDTKPSDDVDWDALLWGGDPNAPMIEYGQEYVVTRGEPLAEGTPLASTDDLVKAVSTVTDPELMLNVYDLGLIYRMDKMTNGDVEVDMTVTAAGCPVAGVMPNQVADALAAVNGVGVVTVKLVWEPAWTIDRMSENARYQLDMF